MQSLIARKALHKSVRGFASSATRAQAVPLEKPVLVKEFKIYRWVRFGLWFFSVLIPRHRYHYNHYNHPLHAVLWLSLRFVVLVLTCWLCICASSSPIEPR